jgi:RNA-binding protein YlmH
MDNKNYNGFLDSFSGDKQRLIYLLDKVKVAGKTWDEIYTDFLTPEEQVVLQKLCKSEKINVSFLGGKGDFERGVACLSKYENDLLFPIEVLRIKGNFKFEKVTHRDYLGALLSLGIKREKVGDINVFDDGAEIWLHTDISDYVLLNLSKIKNTGIKTEKISFDESREKIQKFKQIKINVASMRLDAVISSLLNASRTIASNLISSGSIKVNYATLEEASKKVNEGDIISVKGHGRYIVENILGTTRSDRMVLSIKQYV